MTKTRNRRPSAATKTVRNAPESIKVEAVAIHEVHCWSERAFTEREIAEIAADEEDPTEVATAEVHSAKVRMDGEGRTFTFKKNFRRNGQVKGAPVSEFTLYLDYESWPQFVALVNSTDAKVREVIARNP